MISVAHQYIIKVSEQFDEYRISLSRKLTFFVLKESNSIGHGVPYIILTFIK